MLLNKITSNLNQSESSSLSIHFFKNRGWCYHPMINTPDPSHFEQRITDGNMIRDYLLLNLGLLAKNQASRLPIIVFCVLCSIHVFVVPVFVSNNSSTMQMFQSKCVYNFRDRLSNSSNALINSLLLFTF